MKSRYVFFILVLLVVFLTACNPNCGVKNNTDNIFTFKKEVILPGSPEQIFDAATGDISGWWDHSFTENPKKFFIEAKPGGGFYEIFDDKGNGVLHATVIYSHRGKLLRFDGPLGLSGKALDFVTTYHFEKAGEGKTKFTVEVHAGGEYTPDIPGIVEKVWEHFVYKRFKPYVEGGMKPLN